jgi:hypothetical protein
MAEISGELQVILDFVSGATRPEAFGHALRASPAFAELLDDATELPSRSYISIAGCANTYEFLMTLDLTKLGDALNAQGALQQFMDRRRIAYVRTDEYSSLHSLLIEAQPAWLDVDTEFLRTQVLAHAPELKKTALKAWVRGTLVEMFRFAAKPPRWIQSPGWPIEGNRPLVFLGQFAVKDYFHDEAAVYVFHDPETGECRTVIQVY